MTIWEQNLTILRQVAPALAALLERTEIPADHRLSPSRKGPLTLGVGRRQLHSAYDPVREGEAWARSQVWEGEEPVVVFGLGLGYHLLPVIQRQRPVYVVEPSPAVARLALEHQDLRPLLRGNGLRLGRAFRDLPKQARLLAHPPSRRLHPALYQRLGAFLAGVEPDGKLRVLVAGPLHGGSLPIARAVHRALRGLGHETELLDYAPYHPGYQSLREMFAGGDAGLRLEGHFMGFLARVLEERVRGFRPDLLWFLAQAPVTPPLLRRLKQQVPLIAYWFVEDFQVFPYWRDLAPEVDVFFVLQREPFFGELAGLGVKHYAFLPLAADPAIYRPLELTPEERRRYGSALSFVGAGYANRRQFFQGLLDYDLKIWGSEWDLRSPLGPMVQDGGVRVPEAEAVKIFNAGRINLNLHSSPYCRGINPGGDYLNPRVFDLAACGAFQLVDRRSQLEEFFIPEVELAAFGSLQEARNQADYYLAHEEERREVGRRSRERCLREHTYTVRLAEALALVEEMHPGVLPRRPRPEPPLSELRRRFPPDHPVQEMLARFDAEEVRDLGDLVARLKEGEQPLGEAEAVFWLLHEFHQGLERGRF